MTELVHSSNRWARWLALTLIVATSLGGALGATPTSAQDTTSFRFAF